MTVEPVKRKAFEVPEKFLEHLSSLKDKEIAGETRALCELCCREPPPRYLGCD